MTIIRAPPKLQAPFRSHENAIQGSYIVRLQTGHTLAAHFKYLDREYDHTPLENGSVYFAFLCPKHLEGVREDPGVELVEDNTIATGLGTSYTAPYTKYGDAAVPGSYSVMFREGHTVEKHFAFLGRRFELREGLDAYDANLDESLLAAIRHDPAVEQVEQNPVGGEALGR